MHLSNQMVNVLSSEASSVQYTRYVTRELARDLELKPVSSVIQVVESGCIGPDSHSDSPECRSTC